MRYLKIILFIIITSAFFTGRLHSKPLYYKDFVLGDTKKNILIILGKQKYLKHLIYYDSNDRFMSGIKVKAQNSIKIIIQHYMEKEEILLVFNYSDILFDIYSKRKPADIRDYVDLKIDMVEAYGKPSDDQVIKDIHMLAWSFEKKKYALYLIFDSTNESLITNLRDTYLDAKYRPTSQEQ